MNAFEKIIRPAPAIKTRLHDGAGLAVGISAILRNLPRAVTSRAIMSLTREPPNQPWISYDAARLLERRMAEKPCTVLEFGSGASTAWFAARAAELHSVESDPSWHKLVVKRIAALPANAAKVEYELRTTANSYASFRSDSARMFDIILVDGPWRHLCVRNHLDRLAPDGILYLDNSDADSSTTEEGEIDATLAELRTFAERSGLQERIFTDFASCTLHATQGTMFASTSLFERLIKAFKAK
jgi:predicted O-methyltransferase YrrM